MVLCRCIKHVHNVMHTLLDVLISNRFNDSCNSYLYNKFQNDDFYSTSRTFIQRGLSSWINTTTVSEHCVTYRNNPFSAILANYSSISWHDTGPRDADDLLRQSSTPQ